MGGWRGVAASREVEEERVADFDRDPRLVGPLRCHNLLDVHRAELVAQDRAAGCGLLAIKRLEAAAGQRGDGQRGDGAHQLLTRGNGRARRGLPRPHMRSGGRAE